MWPEAGYLPALNLLPHRPGIQSRNGPLEIESPDQVFDLGQPGQGGMPSEDYLVRDPYWVL